jgi:hypothetical protein
MLGYKDMGHMYCICIGIEMDSYCIRTRYHCSGYDVFTIKKTTYYWLYTPRMYLHGVERGKKTKLPQMLLDENVDVKDEGP